MVCRLNTPEGEQGQAHGVDGSFRVGVSRDAMKRHAIAAQISPTGTLMRKIHPQL
jgi:hypothetical protein